MILEEKFKEYLDLSDKYRPVYTLSLGEAHKNNMDILKSIFLDVPEIYRVIYTRVCGTKRWINEQKFMDFIPGYRLIHIQELAEEKKKLDSIIEYIDTSGLDKIVPLLANYSSDFVCFGKTNRGEELIISVLHDDTTMYTMYSNGKMFLETICEFYKQHVYYLDEDGYLDYDLDREVEIAKKVNPEIEYWEE